MSAVTIYGFAGSTYTRTARMVCEEKGVEHDLQPLDYGSDDHGELHPYRRMPVLLDGDLRLFEALAVSSYLDESRNGSVSLQPADAAARALMLQWVSAINDYVYPDVVRALLSEEEPSEETVEAIRARLEPFDATLRESDWLAGGQLSLADLFLAPIDAFAEARLGGGEALVGLSGLESWRRRIRERPSFAATEA